MFKLSVVAPFFKMRDFRFLCRTALLPLLLVPTIAIACATPEPPPSTAQPADDTVATVAVTTLPKSATATMRLDLSNYLWENRLLLVFAPSEADPNYQQQMQSFEATQAGFADRDLLLIELLADGNSHLNDEAIAQEDVEAVRSRYGAAPEDFTVILIGKDGTQKRQDIEPVSAEAIFSEIDAMPMRQREMQQSN